MILFGDKKKNFYDEITEHILQDSGFPIGKNYQLSIRIILYKLVFYNPQKPIWRDVSALNAELFNSNLNEFFKGYKCDTNNLHN